MVKKAGFSVPVSIAFCINYIVGAGSLTIPWAFHQSGSLLGVLMMLVMFYFSISAVLFLLESMARAEALYTPLISSLSSSVDGMYLVGKLELDDKMVESTPLNNSIDNSTESNVTYNTFHGDLEDIKLLDQQEQENTITEEYVIKKRKFEISELCDIFLGSFGKQIYTCVICVYMYGTLWIFGTVFANSLSSHFHEYLPLTLRNYSYPIFLTVYALIVVPISCLELTEQVFVQVTLSLCRVFMILLMITTILYADYTLDQPFLEFPANMAHESVWRVDLSKLYIILPIAAYANIFHHSIPALSQPVENKKKLFLIYLCTMIFCLFAYSSIGCIISTFFGSEMKTSSNLNWISYSGFSRPGEGVESHTENSSATTTATARGLNMIIHMLVSTYRRLQSSTDTIDTLSISVPTYAKMISAYVVCFPGLDVSSAFPLCAITLGRYMCIFIIYI